VERAKKLLDIINSGLLKMRDARVDSNIHATNLINFCPRAYLLCKKHRLMFNDDSRVTTSRIITFYVGHAVEASIIASFKAEGVSKPIDPFYINITDTDKVVGTPDAAVVIDDPKPYIIELKTTGKDEMTTMIEPYVDHVCQLSLYLWMAEIRKQPFYYDVGFIVYISKIEKKEQIKVYLVHRNDAFLQTVRTQLNVVKTFSKSDALPDRICNSPIGLLAKTCTVCKLCFSEEA